MNSTNSVSTLAALLAILLSAAAYAAFSVSAQALSYQQQLARDIYKELIEIDTTHSTGNTTMAAEAAAKRLKAAGFPDADVQVLGAHPRKGNLVARMRGTGAQRPILLLAHLDVVEAKPEDWSVDPFKLLEKDGYFYGRGSGDDKAMAAILIANLIRYRQEGFKPNRDLIVALTADEESGGAFNGVDWLLKNHRPLIEAEFGINEGGSGQVRNGKKLLNAVQASEKVYQSFLLEIRGKGGHSSRPVKDNVIYHLASALGRLARFEFPIRLDAITRTYFERVSTLESGPTAADLRSLVSGQPDSSAIGRLADIPLYNATMRTTCVATRLEAGHADNALPQTARAVVNCRILLAETAEQVKQTLAKVVADDQITITPMEAAKPSPASPLPPEILRPIERVTAEMWPGVPVVPTMTTGATDSLYLRNAGIGMYGVSEIFHDMDDSRSHGRDERIGVKEFYDGQEFLYRLVKDWSAGARR